MRLLPFPAEHEARPGRFDLTADFAAIAAGHRPSSLPAAWEFSQACERLLHRSVGVRPIDPGDAGRRRIVFITDQVVASTEGYVIDVDVDVVMVRARTDIGLLNAARTLAQLINLDAAGRAVPELPCGRIVDAPRFSWRGMHLDVSRHFFDKADVERWIDLLALHRLNVFHWHLTDDQGWRFPVERFPKLTEVGAWRDAAGGHYSRSEVAHLVDRARRQGITVVPEIEMPGHSLAALAAYPELSCTGGPFSVTGEWGIFEDVLCAGNDAVFEFLEVVLNDVMDLFPGPYVHVGGDECPKARWLSCPKCRERMRREGLQSAEDLQGWFMRRVAEILARRGRRAVGWDEILDGGLAPDATVMSWRGTEGGLQAARLGHDVVMTPTSHCYFDYKQVDRADEPGAIGVIPLERTRAFEPIPDALEAAHRGHVIGVQGNVWTERMPTFDRVQYMALPRLCALAEVAWSAAGADSFGGFRRRLDGHLAWLRALGYGHRPLDPPDHERA